MTLPNHNRIKLAEAMGWKWDTSMRPRDFEGFPDWQCWIKPDGDKWFGSGRMPDPETDANDDYAVLEWMRTMPFENGDWQRINPIDLPMTNYRIGDYARTALKVIDVSA